MTASWNSMTVWGLGSVWPLRFARPTRITSIVSNVAVTAARISAMRSLLPCGRCERWPYSNHCLQVNSAALAELIARHASNVTAERSIVDIRSWIVEAERRRVQMVGSPTDVQSMGDLKRGVHRHPI